MSKIKIYESHSIRGIKGNDATHEDMIANNKIAIEFYKWLSTRFPTIDFYCPAVHDEFVLIAFESKIITEKQILDIDCQILSKCNLLLVYSHDSYISNGMWTEIRYAQKHNIPVLIVQNVQTAEIALNSWLENLRK